MKKSILVSTLIATALILTLSSCQSNNVQKETNNEQGGANELKTDIVAKSAFQESSAPVVAAEALTEDEIRASVPEAEDINRNENKDRTGFGGRMYTVKIAGEDAIQIYYYTVESSDILQENYRLMKESTPDVEDLTFTENGFYAPTYKKIIFITDSYKFDARYIGTNQDVAYEEMLKNLAEKAYNKVEQ